MRREQKLDLTPDLVARCLRSEPDLGPDPDFPRATEAEIDNLVARLLASEHAKGPIWVFAYGSLIWNPAFNFVQDRRGLAQGWHRSFCLDLKRWRGTPERLGLMLALARGGRCAGVLRRLDPASQAADVERLVKWEIEAAEDLTMARWIPVATSEGVQPALVFWAGPSGKGVSHRLAPEVAARRIAQACGHYGSNAEYLQRTVAGLAEHGIRDRALWRLQALVAAEIRSWDAVATSSAA